MNLKTINFNPNGRLYNVRRSSYPGGDHLILSHRSAKILRDYDPKYKIEPRPIVYRNVGGWLVRDQTNRHRRQTTNAVRQLKQKGTRDPEWVDRITAYCFDENTCSIRIVISSAALSILCDFFLNFFLIYVKTLQQKQ